MAELAKGTVIDRPWGKTLASIGLRGVTGTLTVADGSASYTIVFKDGAVVAATSPWASDSPIRLATTAGLLGPAQANDVLRLKAGGLSEVDAIAQLAKFDASQTQKFRRRAIAQQAVRTFALERGNFSLRDEIAQPIYEDCAIDVRAVIYMAARAAVSDQRMELDLNDLPFSLLLTEDARQILGQYGFADGERPALVVLAKGCESLAALEEAGTKLEPKALRAIVYALACTGALELPVEKARTSKSSSQVHGMRRSVAIEVPKMPIVEKVSGAQDSAERVNKQSSGAMSSAPGVSRLSASHHASGNASGAGAVPPKAPALQPKRDPARPTGAEGTRPPSSLQTRGTGATPVVEPPKDLAREVQKVAIAESVTKLIRDRLQILDGGGSHFALLGVSEHDSVDQIRSSYFTLARQLHPDKLASVGVGAAGSANSGDVRRDAQRLFAQINTAFAVLTNPDKRNKYVAVLREGGEAVVNAKQAQAEALATRILDAEDAFSKGEMALRRNQFDVAISELTRATTANPEEGDYVAQLAWAIYCGSHDRSQVLGDVRAKLKQAQTLSPKSILASFVAGKIERMEGNNADAIKHFEEVLRRSPSHQEAQSELRVLHQRDQEEQRTKKSSGGILSMFKK